LDNFWYPIDNFYITDGSGVNISNNNVYDLYYNEYTYYKFFGRTAILLDQSCVLDYSFISRNLGRICIFKFGENQRYNNHYNGGYSFTEDNDYYYFNFLSRCNSYGRSLVLYAVFLVPTMLELENGNLEEYYN